MDSGGGHVFGKRDRPGRFIESIGGFRVVGDVTSKARQFRQRVPGRRPVPNVTRVLECAGLINDDFLGERREECLRRGRAVHEATHRDDNHDLDEESLSAEILGFVEAWRAFRRDFGFVARLVEHTVYNPQFQYA
jgi:hypothetical protein